MMHMIFKIFLFPSHVLFMSEQQEKGKKDYKEIIKIKDHNIITPGSVMDTRQTEKRKKD